MDDRVSAVMADMSPSTWPEARRRLALVRRYVEGGERSAVEAERLAREAGIGRSLFYRLVRIYETHSPLQKPSPRNDRCATPAVSDPTADAISEAIARLGPAATQAKTLRAATALCQARGQPLPTPRMVRAAFTKELAGKDLALRFGTTARLAVDRTMLDIVLDTADGFAGAQLTCLIDLENGRVIRQQVTAGPPAFDDVAELLTVVGDCDGVVLSASDDVLHELTARALSGQGASAPQMSRWRTGAVVRACLGLRLGRVSLLERSPDPAGVEAVDLETARHVVRELLRRRPETYDAAGG